MVALTAAYRRIMAWMGDVCAGMANVVARRCFLRHFCDALCLASWGMRASRVPPAWHISAGSINWRDGIFVILSTAINGAWNTATSLWRQRRDGHGERKGASGAATPRGITLPGCVCAHALFLHRGQNNDDIWRQQRRRSGTSQLFCLFIFTRSASNGDYQTGGSQRARQQRASFCAACQRAAG